MEEKRSLFSFAILMGMWGVSRDLLARAAERGDLRTIYLAGRRMVPRDEVERIEREGLGKGRKYTKKVVQ